MNPPQTTIRRYLNQQRARLGTSRLVTLDIPSALSERVMNALKADPRTVDLRALAPHFYSLSERVLELFEEEEMVDVLINVRLPSAHPRRRKEEKKKVTNSSYRHLRSALQKLLTMPTTQKVLLATALSF